MGDSDIAGYLSLFVLLVIVAGVIAFVIAWRLPNRRLRLIVGAVLLATAATFGLLSAMAVPLVGAMGVASLVLGIRTPRTTGSMTRAPDSGRRGDGAFPEG